MNKKLDEISSLAGHTCTKVDVVQSLSALKVLFMIVYVHLTSHHIITDTFTKAEICVLKFYGQATNFNFTVT